MGDDRAVRQTYVAGEPGNCEPSASERQVAAARTPAVHTPGIMPHVVAADRPRLVQRVFATARRPGRQNDRLALRQFLRIERDSGRLSALGMWPTANSCGSRTSTHRPGAREPTASSRSSKSTASGSGWPARSAKTRFERPSLPPSQGMRRLRSAEELSQSYQSPGLRPPRGVSSFSCRAAMPPAFSTGRSSPGAAAIESPHAP